MWEYTKKDGTKYLQERVTNELTGDEHIVSVKIKSDSRTDRRRARERLDEKITKKQPKKDKLSDVAALYLQSQERQIKPTTYITASCALNKAVEIVGDIYVEKLTAGHIKKQLLNCGKSNSVCNGYIKQLKACLRWAYMNDIIDDPGVYQKLTRFQVQSARERIQDKYLEPDELNKLIEETNGVLSLLIRFAALTGMRIGEIIALDNGDIWGSEIHITKTYGHLTKQVGSPKTATSNREIHIQPELAECIKEIRAYMKMQQENCGYPERPYLFCNQFGDRIVYGTVENRLKTAGKRILNRDITFHILRHTHASILAAAGVPLESISRRLGHEGCEITKAIYIHQTEKAKERDAAALDKITMLKAVND